MTHISWSSDIAAYLWLYPIEKHQSSGSCSLFSTSDLKFIVGYCKPIFHGPVILGWSGGAMVLGKLPVPGRPTFWIMVGQGPIAFAVGAGGVLFGHFYSLLSFLSSFSLSLGDGLI